MKLGEMQVIAERIKAELALFCESDRCCIAGSVRRKRPEPRDLEIVCIPKTIPGGLFQNLADRDPGFIRVVNHWFAVKGDAATGKYTQRILPDGIKLDLFMVTVDNFGLQMAIRTGSADYTHFVLAAGWVKKGFNSEQGFLWQNGRRIPIPAEQDLFDLIGIPWVEPELRDIWGWQCRLNAKHGPARGSAAAR